MTKAAEAPGEGEVEGRSLRDLVSSEVWTQDFVHDQLATGPKLRILSLMDTCTRFLPAVVPRFSFQALDVFWVLDRVCGRVAYPASIWEYLGIKLMSEALTGGRSSPWFRRCAASKGCEGIYEVVTLDFSRLGALADNAFIGTQPQVPYGIPE